MFMPQENTTASCALQQLQVPQQSLKLQPMVARTLSGSGFSERLNWACDDYELPSGHGRIAELHRLCLKNDIKITPQGVRKWLSENAIPRMSNASKLAKILGINTEWLVSGNGPMRSLIQYGATPGEQDRMGGHLKRRHDELVLMHPELDYVETEDGPYVVGFKPTPVVGTAQLGPDGYWDEIDYPVGHGDGFVDVPTRDPNAYALRVKGQSMAPAIRDGWLVVCEPNSEPIPGEYVLVKTVDGRSMIKELLYSKPEGVSLMSVNDGYGRINLTWDEIEKMHPAPFIISPSKHRL